MAAKRTIHGAFGQIKVYDKSISVNAQFIYLEFDPEIGTFLPDLRDALEQVYARGVEHTKREITRKREEYLNSLKYEV